MKLKTCLLSLFFSSLVTAAPINTLVVFGDSLSDNGNLYEYMQHRIPQSPPYYEGRFSNGPVWIERLVNAVFPNAGSTHLLDYAIGGAGVSAEDNEDEALFTLNNEMNAYVLAHEGKADENSLYVVWIGANNYLALPDDDARNVQVVTESIRKNLQRLVDMGARHILVMNLPDLGTTPAALEFEARERLTWLARHHNQVLNEQVQEFQRRYPGVTWFQYDVYTAFNDIIASPERYGITNVSDTCYDAIMGKPSGQAVLRMAAKPGYLADDQCKGYLFFDPVHVTQAVHQVVADQVRELLQVGGLEFVA